MTRFFSLSRISASGLLSTCLLPAADLHTTPAVIERPAIDSSKPLYPQPDDATLLANFDKEFANQMPGPPRPPTEKYDAKWVELVTQLVREKWEIKRGADGVLIGKEFGAGIPVSDFLNGFREMFNAYAAGNPQQRAEVLTLATDAIQYFNEKSAPVAGGWYNWANYGNTRPRFDLVYPLVHLVPQDVGDTFAEKLFHFQALSYPNDPALQMDHLKSYGAEVGRLPIAVRDPKRRLALVKKAHKYTGDLILSHGNFNSEGGPSHHRLLHYYYANYSIDLLFNSYMAYHRAGWYFSEAVYEKVRRIATSAAFVTAGSRGVHPFNGGGRPGLPLNMNHSVGKWLESAARSGFQGDPKALFPAYAATFAYMNPEHPSAKEFIAAGIKPAPFPEGNIAVNFGNLVSHRRKEWNIMAAGVSPSSRHMEIYSWVQYNHYARFARSGTHIITDPSFSGPDNDAGLEVSNGFNWAFIPGATCPATPEYRLMVRRSKNYIGSIGIAGGCSLDGNGVWAANQTSQIGGITFRKSGFFFGDHVTFLTTNVAAVIPKDATEGEKQINTTLLQWPVKQDSMPLEVGKNKITRQPTTEILPLDRSRVIIDSKGNGYVVAPNANARLRYRRGSQTFHMLRDIYVIDKKSPQPIDWHKMLLHGEQMNDKNLKDAERLYAPRTGDYEVVYLNHTLTDGSDKAGSAYTILPMAGKERTEKFAAELASDNPPGKILQMNKTAHVYQDRDTGSLGYAVFEPSAALPDGPLISVSNQATLLFRKHSGGSWAMSVAVPLDNKIRDTTILIRGHFNPTPPPGHRMEVTHLPDGTTRLRWLQHDYAAATFELVPVQPQE